MMTYRDQEKNPRQILGKIRKFHVEWIENMKKYEIMFNTASMLLLSDAWLMQINLNLN